MPPKNVNVVVPLEINDHISSIAEVHQTISENIDKDVVGIPKLEPVNQKFILGNKHAKFEKIRKYTYEIFLERAFIIHGNVFDYSAVTKEDVICARSTITITCKICEYTWPATISAHIYYKTGCASCEGSLPNTYEFFLFKTKKRFADKYTFNLIKDGKNGSDTLVSITCNKCKDLRSMTTNDFMNEHRLKDNCPKCKKLVHQQQISWTYDRFIY